jgi:hypothetical protein
MRSDLPGKDCRGVLAAGGATSRHFVKCQDSLFLTLCKDGSFALTLSLPVGQQYRFRYLLDGERWTNDPAADASIPNPFGSADSVVQV